MAYRNRRTSRGYRNSGSSRRRSYGNRTRRSGNFSRSRRRTAGARAGRSGRSTQTVRIVVEQPPAQTAMPFKVPGPAPQRRMF